MYTPINETFGLIDSFLAAFISILIVFVVLTLIIVIANAVSSLIMKVDSKNNINPRIENKILQEDEDSVVATIVASMDYYNETKKNSRVVSVTREEGE